MVSGEPRQPGDAAPVEVRLYRGDDLAHRQLCESAEEAASLVEQWADRGITRVDVDDLSTRHEPGEILEPERFVDVADPDDGHERP
jgi:hypothetical protein